MRESLGGRAARRAGVRAVTMNSANAHEWGEVTAALGGDRLEAAFIRATA